MALSINCIEVDCKDQNKCPCGKNIPGKVAQHFEIPQLMDGLGAAALLFVGSTDKSTAYNIYYNLESIRFQKYRRFSSTQPYVYVDKTPNENGMCDCWIFNAPFVKYVSVVGIFKDPRQLERYNCCESTSYLDMGSVSSEIIRRILAKKASLYRVMTPPAAQTTA